MRSKGIVFVSIMLASWTTVSKGFVRFSPVGGFGGAGIGAGLLALGGLGAIKKAALLGFAATRYGGGGYGGYGQRGYGYGYGHRYGRAVDDIESENKLSLTTEELDPNGCIEKLLCYLRLKKESDLALQEKILISIFSGNSETKSKGAFLRAMEAGDKSQNETFVCSRNYPMCPLIGEQLSLVLRQAWDSSTDD